MHRRTRLVAPILTATIAASLLGAGPALGVVSCTFDAPTATITVTMAQSTGTTITRDTNGNITVCGGSTITNTDTILVNGDAATQFVTIDLVNGPIGPGKTAEASGASEIEIIFNLGDGLDRVTVSGSSGNDTYRVGATGIELTGDADVDATTGGVDDIELRGKGGADVLVGSGFGAVGATGVRLTIDGGSGNDTLAGGGASDTFKANGGNDQMTGGAGNDIADYGARTTALHLSLDGNANDGAGAEADNIATDIERVIGGTAGDTITGSSLANTIWGGPGDDAINGGSGEDILIGGGGTDAIDGSLDNDTIYGGNAGIATGTADALDLLSGGPGNDLMYGEDGADLLDGGSNNDTLDGGLGGDHFIGGSGIDRLSYAARTAALKIHIGGGAISGESLEADDIEHDVEQIVGGSGNDLITDTDLAGVTGGSRLDGRGGNDTLRGGGGNDTILGGEGNDLVYGGAGTNVVFGEAGADVLMQGDASQAGQVGADIFYGGDGSDRTDYRLRTTGLVVSLDGLANDGAVGEGDNNWTDVESIYGGSGWDTLRGNALSNTLRGYAGNDTLEGFDATDFLEGGPGADLLKGGAGNDFLLGEADSDRLQGGTGNDFMDGGSLYTDIADYRDHATGVTIDLTDGNTGEGSPGESDTLIGFEQYTGTNGHDTMKGTDANETFITLAGNDTVNGGGGSDRMSTGAGADYIHGGGDPATGGKDSFCTVDPSGDGDSDYMVATGDGAIAEMDPWDGTGGPVTKATGICSSMTP